MTQVNSPLETNWFNVSCPANDYFFVDNDHLVLITEKTFEKGQQMRQIFPSISFDQLFMPVKLT